MRWRFSIVNDGADAIFAVTGFEVFVPVPLLPSIEASLV